MKKENQQVIDLRTEFIKARAELLATADKLEDIKERKRMYKLIHKMFTLKYQ